MRWSDPHKAVEHEDIEALADALARSGDVDDPAADGATLLHHAIDVEVDGAAQTGEPLRSDITRYLVDCGADLDRTWDGQTPYEMAVSRGHYLAAEIISASLRRSGPPAD